MPFPIFIFMNGDIYTQALEVDSAIYRYIKHIGIINKHLRKKFPKDKNLMNDRHELQRLVHNVWDSIQKLEAFALGQHTLQNLCESLEG